jgi:hypothetical protein
MLDVKQPEPALLTHRQRDEAAKLDKLRFGEVRMEPVPERVGRLEAPGDGLGVGQGGLLALPEAL